MERRTLYGGAVALTGVVLGVVQVVHAYQQSSQPVFVLVDAVPMVAVALALSFAGSHLAREEEYEPDLTRALGWTIGGIVVFVSFAALTLFSQNVATGEIARASFVAVDHITMGATAGMLVGIYDARARERRRDLESERDRVEAFATKAADLNNYGRAIAQSDDTAGVGAFCIEAVSTLFGFDESAFVELSEDENRVVGKTMVGIDDDTVRTMAERATDQEIGTVEVIDEPTTELGRDVGRAVRVLVAVHRDRSFVLLSLADADEPVADEDRQLFELLVSHAGMSLDHIGSEN